MPKLLLSLAVFDLEHAIVCYLFNGDNAEQFGRYTESDSHHVALNSLTSIVDGACTARF